MADLRKILNGNAPGDFFVDSSCIDCDLCRQIAPGVFREENDASVVDHQPAGPEELRRAEMALLSCPTGSIGTVAKHDLGPAIASFPEPVEGNVHFCGFASDASYGASSYLIVRPQGNVLVDSPRFTAPLVRRIADLGGVRWMFLTHQDDVADHRKFHERFGCDRILHEEDAGLAVERPIRGIEPVRLDDDLVIVPTPGHTAGHQVLLYRDRFLFTGDHVWWDPELRHLAASHRYCWHSWSEQRRSMGRLLDWSFEWILPGHGARHHAPAPVMHRLVEDLVRRMD
jgi:glyoxylase-like metal-dependent hydrolase (beta-lactamase superfamily II)/ferredoxin